MSARNCSQHFHHGSLAPPHPHLHFGNDYMFKRKKLKTLRKRTSHSHGDNSYLFLLNAISRVRFSPSRLPWVRPCLWLWNNIFKQLGKSDRGFKASQRFLNSHRFHEKWDVGKIRLKETPNPALKQRRMLHPEQPELGLCLAKGTPRERPFTVYFLIFKS